MNDKLENYFSIDKSRKDGFDKCDTEVENGCEESECSDDINPWPYVSKFYKFIEKDSSKNYTFACVLCEPKMQVIKCNEKSRNGLKTIFGRGTRISSLNCTFV